MSTPIATKVARLSARGLCAAVALALSLTCILLAVAASTAPMTGMGDLADASPSAAATAAPEVALGIYTSVMTDGAVGDVVREAASPVATVMLPTMSSMCDSACVGDVSEMCTTAAGIIAITLLALLLASHRDTYMGLLPRARTPALPHRRRRKTPWTVVSPITLCVLRV